jgi:hypothetical protein
MRKSLYIAIIIAAISNSSLQAQELYRMPDGRQSHVSSFENGNGDKGKGGRGNHGAKGNAAESLNAGQTKALLDTHSAGIIQRIWITVDDRSPQMLRSLRLRMYWDGAEQAAVDVPLGDFFCAGLGQPVAFQSALFSDPEGRSFNCAILMPFKTGARLTLTNESGKDLSMVFFDIDFVTTDKAPSDLLYFHACWNRSKKQELGRDMELLPHVIGKGRFLGVNVGVRTDSAYENTWWGEGEVKMYIDGDDANPTINGTGAEDYIGTGWGEGAFSNQYQGCLLAGGKDGRDYSFYRFHIPDEIYFYHDMRVTIQELGGFFAEKVRELHKKGVPLLPVTIGGIRLVGLPDSAKRVEMGGAREWMNFYRSDDYSATAYFYLDSPVSSLKPLVPVEQRIQ